MANLQLELGRNAAQVNTVVAQAVLRQRRRRRRNRTIMFKPWLQRRNLRLGQYERLMAELRDEDIPAFRNFLRVKPAMFNELLNRLGEKSPRKIPGIGRR